eukprot:415453-Pelagomonas_calceolata.AAC.1
MYFKNIPDSSKQFSVLNATPLILKPQLKPDSLDKFRPCQSWVLLSELNQLAAEAQQGLLRVTQVPLHKCPVRVVAIPIVVAVVGLGNLITCKEG